MKLQIERLSATPQDLRFEITPGWWRTRVPEAGDGSVDLDETLVCEAAAYLAGSDVVLEGHVAGSVGGTCSRCLARYRHALREDFRLVLEPAGDRVPADPEGAAAVERDGLWLGDELEAGWFRGSEIDLSGFLTEVVALALPVKPLCSESCAGLCPRCGVDRNQAACECEDTPAHSPFAALAVLRQRAGPGAGGDGSTGGSD